MFKFKLFSTYIDPKASPKEYLHIRCINENNNLPDSLGITEKRFDELAELVNISFAKNSRVSQAAEEVSKSCTHPNELFIVGYLIGKHAIRNPLSEIFAAIVRKPPEQ